MVLLLLLPRLSVNINSNCLRSQCFVRSLTCKSVLLTSGPVLSVSFTFTTTYPPTAPCRLGKRPLGTAKIHGVVEVIKNRVALIENTLIGYFYCQPIRYLQMVLTQRTRRNTPDRPDPTQPNPHERPAGGRLPDPTAAAPRLWNRRGFDQSEGSKGRSPKDPRSACKHCYIETTIATHAATSSVPYA